jgi:MFS family permease
MSEIKMESLSKQELKKYISEGRKENPSNDHPNNDDKIEPLSRKELKSFVDGPDADVYRRVSLQEERETLICCKLSLRLKAYKNLFAVCISFILCFGSFKALLSLQSSVNAAEGLGLANSAVSYIFVIISCVFSPSYVKLVGTKYSLITGYVFFLLQVLFNYYPSWYTLIPGSVINGIGQPSIWISIYAHVVSIAIKYYIPLKETKAHAIVLFTGMVTASVKLSQVPGSAVSSIVLINLGSGSNSTENITDSRCLVNETVSLNKEDDIYFVLISCLVFMDIIGLLVAVVFLDHLGTEFPFYTAKKMVKLYVIDHFTIFFKTVFHWKLLLIFPMFVLDGLALGFTFGTIPKVLIADCIGVQWIGFAIALSGIAGSCVAVICGRSARYFPQYVLVYASITGLLGLSLFLIFWEIQASFLAAYLFTIAWGLFETTFNTVGPAMLSFLFPGEKKESALSLLQVGVGIGFVIIFVTGIFWSHIIQLWIIIGVVVITTITYTIVFFMTTTKSRLAPCVFKEKENTDDDIEEEEEINEFEVTLTNFNPLSTRSSVDVKNV